jgi:hypothetical protein
VRKYILNTKVLNALFSAFVISRANRGLPRDWRTILIWISWGLAVAIAIGGVLEEAKVASEEPEQSPKKLRSNR